MLEIWGMQSTSSLPFLKGTAWHGEVAPGRVLSKGQIELNHGSVSLMLLYLTVYLSKTEWLEMELFWNVNFVFMLNWIVWKRDVFYIKSEPR